MKPILLFFLLSAAISGFAQKATPPRLHKELSDFTLKTPEGNELRLSSLRGKVVLVDFWASWCMPCRVSIPHLKELYAKYSSAGMEIVSVSIDARPEAWTKAVGQEKMSWPQVMDSYKGTGDYSDMALAYGVKMIPWSVLLDKEGKVLAINPAPQEMDKQLKKIFGN